MTNNQEKQNIYLSIVMPAYNEGAHIEVNLLKTSEIIAKFVKNYEIIAVDDGSSDGTSIGMENASQKDSHIKYVTYSPNKGKGHAIVKGVEEAQGKFIAFLDSDLELNPSMLRYFIKALNETNADIAIGSKLHKKSKLEYPLTRKIMSVGYFIILKILFKLNIKDTQTGIKLFKSSVIKPICQNLSTTGFAFDIEILATAASKGYKIIEMPIELVFLRDRKEKSRITFKTIINVFNDTLYIKKKLRGKQNGNH